jgi:hypothetical protein
VQRIDPIRRDEDSPWVAPTSAVRPVGRRQPGEDEQERRRRRPRPQDDGTPDGRPDADGHIDVSA